MDNPETSMLVASRRDLPVFTMNAPALEAKNKALEASALIGKVTNADSKIIAVRAQQQLKRVISDIEKARKELKEPLLAEGRQLYTLCATETLPLDKEFGRVSNLVKEFDDDERRRVAEEERLQREELERIEREKQAELKRIADEQERVQREAIEAAAAAAKLAAEATNKKQREAAALAQAESERIRKEAEAKAIAAAAQISAIEEKAGDAAYCASRPIAITKVAGQRTTSDWKITKINDWVLAKARPDLVSKITFDMRALKDELKRGVKLPGVEAEEEYSAGVKLPPAQRAIEV